MDKEGSGHSEIGVLFHSKMFRHNMVRLASRKPVLDFPVVILLDTVPHKVGLAWSLVKQQHIQNLAVTHDTC